MTEHAGVVRDENGLTTGLHAVAEIDERTANIGVRPDIAGYQDLAHAFDLEHPQVASTDGDESRQIAEKSFQTAEQRQRNQRADWEMSAKVFRGIEGSAIGNASEDDFKGLFDDLDVNSGKLGPTVAKRSCGPSSRHFSRPRTRRRRAPRSPRPSCW